MRVGASDPLVTALHRSEGERCAEIAARPQAMAPTSSCAALSPQQPDRRRGGSAAIGDWLERQSVAAVRAAREPYRRSITPRKCCRSARNGARRRACGRSRRSRTRTSSSPKGYVRRREEALRHLDDARRAAEDARAIDEDNIFVISVRANVARTRAEFEPDPAARAQLMREAEELMLQARTRHAQHWQLVTWSSPPAPGGLQAGVGRRAQCLRGRRNIRPPAKSRTCVRCIRWRRSRRGFRVSSSPKSRLARTAGSPTSACCGRFRCSIRAAIDAVRQWEFEPTLLNGRPVPIIMTVTVSFSVM